MPIGVLDFVVNRSITVYKGSFSLPFCVELVFQDKPCDWLLWFLNVCPVYFHVRSFIFCSRFNIDLAWWFYVNTILTFIKTRLYSPADRSSDIAITALRVKNIGNHREIGGDWLRLRKLHSSRDVLQCSKFLCMNFHFFCISIFHLVLNYLYLSFSIYCGFFITTDKWVILQMKNVSGRVSYKKILSLKFTPFF